MIPEYSTNPVFTTIMFDLIWVWLSAFSFVSLWTPFVRQNSTMQTRALLLLLIPVLLKGDTIREALDTCCGRCVGSSYCSACTTCNYCKYCNSGGSCGVCGGGSGSGGSNRRSGSSGQAPSRIYPQTVVPQSERTAVTIQYYVTATMLNVRSGPGINYLVTDKVAYGTQVRIDNRYNSGWCFIRYYSNGLLLSGFVLMKHLAYYYV